MRRKMKRSRWASVLVAAILLMCCCPTTAYAAEGDAIVLTASETELEVGGSVTVRIDAADAGEITDGKLTLTYDSSVLAYEGTQSGPAWTEASGELEYDANGDTAGSVILAFAAEEAADEGTIFTVTFQALAAGSAQVGVDNSDSYLTGVDGGVSVSVDITVTDPDDPGPGPDEPDDPDDDRPSIRPPKDPVQPSTGDDKDDDVTDVPEEDVPLGELPGLDTVDRVAYLTGYEDGTVRPEGQITRAEVATIFYRLMTDEYRATYGSTSNSFSDVNAGNWYNEAVSTVAAAGWIAGYPDGTFRPNNYITRAEFATIASRFLSEEYVGQDMFNDIAGRWSAEYINRVAQAGWITGYPDGSFRPDANITRAEAVTVINRMLGREFDASQNTVRWPDNPETAWYYEAIQAATNG